MEKEENKSAADNEELKKNSGDDKPDQSLNDDTENDNKK